MRELHAYENEDGTFRVKIHDKVEYLLVKGTKEIKDIIAKNRKLDTKDFLRSE